MNIERRTRSAVGKNGGGGRGRKIMSHEGSTTRGVLRKVRPQIRWNKKNLMDETQMKPRNIISYISTKLPFKRLSSSMSGHLSAMNGAAQGRVMLSLTLTL